MTGLCCGTHIKRLEDVPSIWSHKERFGFFDFHHPRSSPSSHLIIIIIILVYQVATITFSIKKGINYQPHKFTHTHKEISLSISLALSLYNMAKVMNESTYAIGSITSSLSLSLSLSPCVTHQSGFFFLTPHNIKTNATRITNFSRSNL